MIAPAAPALRLARTRTPQREPATDIAAHALEAALDAALGVDVAAAFRAEASPGSSLWMVYDAAAVELDRRADVGWSTYASAVQLAELQERAA